MATVVSRVGAVQAGPFNIIFELSSANSAPVIKQYLGKRAGLDEIVLLKTLVWTKTDYVERMQDIQRGKNLIYTEFTMLSLLHGMPGICRHHGLFKDKVPVADGSEEEMERVILALDYSNYYTLEQYVMKHKQLPEKEALKLFQEIVTIISQMHTRNIVHRDINLGNVTLNLITRKVTLVGFYLSTHIFNDRKLTGQQGSLAYVSPDILSGAPYCGKASDCWALGVLLYIMLYGKFPFYDKNGHKLIKKIKSAQCVIPNDQHACLGTRLLISELIMLDPIKRLTAAAAVEETKRILSKWHSGTDIPPQVPDIDNQPGDEDLYVPGSASYTLTNSEEVADMGNNESALLAIGLIA